MFFSLTALGPASLGLPPARAATARSAAAGRPRARAASPRSRAGRAGGRAGGSDAWHCPALWPRPLPASPPPTPGLFQAGRATHGLPLGHPVPTRGSLTFWAPASGPWVLLAPRVPGHVLSVAAAHPTRLPALGGEPGMAPSCLGARPGLGNFPVRVCVRGGAGVRWCWGTERPRCPPAAPPPPAPVSRVP